MATSQVECMETTSMPPLPLCTCWLCQVPFSAVSSMIDQLSVHWTTILKPCMALAPVANPTSSQCCMLGLLPSVRCCQQSLMVTSCAAQTSLCRPCLCCVYTPMNHTADLPPTLCRSAFYISSSCTCHNQPHNSTIW